MSDLFCLRGDALANLAVSRDQHGEWECGCSGKFRARCDDAEFPTRFANRALGDLDWDCIEPPDARTTLQEYCANIAAYLDESIGLILSGPVGCGKTHLAIGAAKLACAFGYTALFVNAPTWFQELRESYGTSNSTVEQERMEQMRTADVLILDDLGAEKPSDWARERLYIVINHRALARRVTFATTNRALEELEHVVGERVMSRLYGDALALALVGSDYRQVEREHRLRCIRDTARGVRELSAEKDRACKP
ncbi:MAG: ATP-binding protein [Chloroflexi bacterium]|nr:ATP-binding protein [Chloroflexota bacterium]